MSQKVKNTKVKKQTLKEAEEALSKLNIGEKDQKINEINTAIAQRNYSELAEYVARLSRSKDCQLLFGVLSKISEQPQTFRGKDEFDTIYNTAILDGERGLVRKLYKLIEASLNGDMESVESYLSKGNLV